MKLPNGYGSIDKLSGKRRKPYRVRAGCRYGLDGTKLTESRSVIGYYATKTEAMQALAEYNKNPYDLSANKMTFAEVVELWKQNIKLADNTISSYCTALNFCSEINTMPFKSIGLNQLQAIVNVNKPSIQKMMRNALNSVYDFAIKREITDKNIAKNIEVEKSEKQHEKYIFTADEIEKLWSSEGVLRDVILVLIYSGWRISELINLGEDDINWDEKIMKGGIKTAAGKNRIVPIHPRIEPLLKNIIENGEMKRHDRRYFHKYIKNLTGKTPHECRHTFVTNLYNAGVDELVIQRLVGHTSSTVTKSVYTHITIEQLREAILKLS